tara:strand:- start:7317 stop:8090 length:774 start_codon:yes stop_codon:yes gene_type:complete
MYEITIKHKAGPRVYKVLDKEEAIELGLEFHPWEDAKEGEWGCTDDDVVAEVITRKNYEDVENKKINVYLRYPWGTHFFNPKYTNKALQARGRESNATLSGKTYLKVMSKTDKFKKLAMLAAMMKSPDDVITEFFGVDTTPRIRRKWKRTMRTEVFQDMVREELEKRLTDHGLTEDYTFDLLKETIEKCKDKNDTTNLMRIVENLQEMHGMKGKNVIKTTNTLEATSSKLLLDELHEEEKLIATQTEVKEVDVTSDK